MTARNGIVVDADTHFWQPLEIWEGHIDAAHRAAVTEYAQRLKSSSGPKVNPIGMEEARRLPSDDPVGRLEWMDSEGIDACVIYPSTMNALCCAEDADVAVAASRGLNRWSAEFASHAPERFKPCMVLPWNLPERALEEFEIARELGLETAYVSPTPSSERRWSDPALDPVWGAMERAGTVVNLHEFTRFPNGSQPVVARPTYTYQMRYLCGHTVELQLSLMDLVLGGVFSRFPNLRIGLAEGHVAWLPGWLDMLDTAWERPVFRDERDPSMDEAVLPSELFRRQGFVVAFPDDRGIDVVVERVGAHVVMLSTDYPHPNATYGLVERFHACYPDIGEEIRQRLLGGNAADVFRLTARVTP